MEKREIRDKKLKSLGISDSTTSGRLSGFLSFIGDTFGNSFKGLMTLITKGF